MARVVLSGRVQPSELPLMSFELMEAIAREQRRQARRLKRDRAMGGQRWNWKSIPEPENPDGPPEKDHFIAYGLNLGLPLDFILKEWDRQEKKGGW